MFDKDSERNDAVNELLIAVGLALSKRRANNIIAPQKYVVRGGRNEKIAMEEASWAEYFAALCQMIEDRKLPSSWPSHLFTHMYQLATMATNWDWYTCRQWSETVFSMIADGRLPRGWSDQYAIKDVQRDVCALGTRLDKAKQNLYNKLDNGGRPNSNNSTHNEHGKVEYDRETDGKPCNAWYWGNDCAHSTSHGLHPDRQCHICSWCAKNYKKANMHQEKVCQNKQRFLEKANAKPATKQDF